MSIDEMILFLKHKCSMGVEKDDVIAALKAGQAMRMSLDVFADWSAERTGRYYVTPDMVAWDAATKGEDV